MSGDRAALVARITGNWDGLKKTIADAGVAIQTTTKSMEKLANSLQGGPIISQAAKITAVIQGIGGVSELTQKQAQNMLRQMSEGFERLKLSTGGVPADIQKVHDQLVAVTA